MIEQPQDCATSTLREVGGDLAPFPDADFGHTSVRAPAGAIGIPPELYGPVARPYAVRLDGADLIVTGEIDLTNAAQIESEIIPRLHGAEHHLDLAAVNFIDSQGVALLVRAYACTSERGAQLRITCSAPVYYLLSISGLTNLPGLSVTNAEPA